MSDTIHALSPGTDLRFPIDVPDDYDGYEYLVDEHGYTAALGDQDAGEIELTDEAYDEWSQTILVRGRR